MKKREKNKLYVGIFITFLMVSSTIGFIASYSDGGRSNNVGSDNIKYKGYSFTRTDQGWTTDIDGVYWVFDYDPASVNFETDYGVLTNKIYIYMEDDSSFAEISQKFALLGIIVEEISLDEVDCSSNFSNLVFARSNYNKIYKDDRCVYLGGNVNQLSDRLFYGLLGVI